MRRTPSLLARIWRKLRGSRTKPPRTPKPRRFASPEPLEGRVAPATLINPTTIMFKDFDGDIVTVKFTKSLFAQSTNAGNLAIANNLFKFDTGTVDKVSATFDAATAPAQQLQLLDLTQAPSKNGVNISIGTGITISAVKAGNGNGFVDVGYIRANEPAHAASGGNPATTAKEIPLGAVSIAGDLGQIDAGASTTAIGLASLKVKSLGQRAVTDTQRAADPVNLPSGRSLVSNITGALGSLTVTDNVNGASVIAANGSNVSGKIGAITIGGSLIGTATDNSGSIVSPTDIGAVKIGTNSTQGIVGAGGKNSGSIRAGDIFLGKIASLTVAGSITAGGGAGSGLVSTNSTIGAVSIGGSIDATVIPAATGSGGIQADGGFTTVTIKGALKGGATPQTGFITSGRDIGAISVHDIIGGAGTNSGSISAGGKIAALTVLGNVTGAGGFGSASVFSGADTTRVGDIGAVKIGGKLEGGSQQNSGTIGSGGKIASISIGPTAAVDQVTLKGGGALFAGSIFSRGAIGPVRVSGHIEGGGGDFSGSIVSNDFITPDLDRAGDLGAVTVTGHVKGGAGNDSGQISADGKIASVTLGTVGLTDGDLSGGNGARSGNIRSGQGVVNPGITGAILIKGDLTGGVGAQSGGIFAEGKIASVSVTKDVSAGTIRSGDDIASITVGGNVSNGTQISARGQATPGATTDLAIGKITVNGSVSNTRIRAGYDTTLTNAVNPDAQIGAVFVKLNWTASDIFAGVIDGDANGFGTAGDVKIPAADNLKIVSQIASIVIGGTVTGTVGSGDHFGFVAQKIGALKVGATVFAFNATVGQSFDLAADVTSREAAI
jgi:hypothetical protein